MIAACTSCHKVIENVDKVRGVRCPNCKQWNSLVSITKEQAKAMPKRARVKEARP